jgi:hypothetical protein
MIENISSLLEKDSNYIDLFKRNLNCFLQILKNEKNYEKEKYCLSFPMIGKNYNKGEGLFVVGRATNGWDNCFSVGNMKNTDELIKQSIDSSLPSKNKCVFDEWFEEYNQYRSSFWRVTERITKEIFNNSNVEWTNNIAWSNLFKIAPKSGGNPNKTEQAAQEKWQELIFMEIDTLQPKYVLLITDWELWAEKLMEGKTIETIKEIQDWKKEKEYVRFVGKYNKSKIIITFRPEREPEDVFVNDVKIYF